jgi:2-desacetyl-2-hydroxyethyl bacteriochlorophyllide A dehydrogenase
MQAALFHGPRELEIADYTMPVPAADEVLIKVRACGVCGTDYHIFNGEAPAKAPVIIGHEYTGEVVETGRNVTAVKPGDNIVVNPNIHCGYCDYCREGYIHLCVNLKALGVTLNGGFAQFSAVPLSQAYLIPAGFPHVYAAFAEPLSCCLHGINQAEIRLSDTVVIIGAGTIGIFMMQLAQLRGAGTVIVLEPQQAKRDIALNLGAGYALDPTTYDFTQNFSDILPGGADVVIECAGNRSAAETALNVVRKGGRIVIFGLAAPTASLNLPLQSFFHKELTIKSSLLNPYTFQTAVDLIVSNKINVGIIHPYEIPLDNSSLQNLFTGSKNSAVIKYLVKPN